MSKSDTLIALAERCEAAIGPDRGIDRDIALALGEYDRPEDMGCFHDPAQAVVGGGGKTYAPPEYTASIDAAMTLVPEGERYELANMGDGVHRGFVTAGDLIPWDDCECCPATTPALAFTAAALRAIAAQVPA